MSMYNLVCGSNKLSTLLLSMLDMTIDDIPRFRDCFLTKEHIVIYTRTGGSNRLAYAIENNILQSHSLYVKTEDDNMDHSYANFFYAIPEKYKNITQHLYEQKVTVTPTEKWGDIFTQLVSIPE